MILKLQASSIRNETWNLENEHALQSKASQGSVTVV